MASIMLLSKLSRFYKSSIIFGLESTAHYGDNLVRYLVESSCNVCVINPLQTSSLRKNNIRKTKTDNVDTFIIAKTLMMQDSYRFITRFDLDVMNLKTLGRFRQKTIKQRTRLKIQPLLMLTRFSLSFSISLNLGYTKKLSTLSLRRLLQLKPLLLCI